MLEYILLSLGFLAILAGTINDIKTREVPDYATFGLIFTALGIRLIFAVGTFDWSILIEGVLGFLFFTLIAIGLFYLGQWGGGDAKLLMGLGAVFGLQWNPFHNSIAFMINLLIAGGAYGLCYTMFLAIQNRKKVHKSVKNLLAKKEMAYGKFFIYGLTVIIVAAAFYLTQAQLPLLIMAGATLLSFYLYILMRSLESICFHKTIDVDRLTEGDWILKEVHVQGKYITGPKDLGISKKQIKQLKQLKKNKKIKNITIKEGIPFVPSFFFAYVITLVWGNLVLLFI